MEVLLILITQTQRHIFNQIKTFYLLLGCTSSEYLDATKTWCFHFSGDTWRSFTDVGSPPSESSTFSTVVVSLSLGSFELKYLSSHIVVPGQREGGGEASIRPALFRRPPLWLGERDTRTKLHINRYPPRELLSYTTPTTSHQLPQSLKREREERGQRCRGGKTAALHPDKPKPKLLSSWLSWRPAETQQQRGGLKLAVWPKTNNVLGLNLTVACRLCSVLGAFLPP